MSHNKVFTVTLNNDELEMLDDIRTINYRTRQDQVRYMIMNWKTAERVLSGLDEVKAPTLSKLKGGIPAPPTHTVKPFNLDPPAPDPTPTCPNPPNGWALSDEQFKAWTDCWANASPETRALMSKTKDYPEEDFPLNWTVELELARCRTL